MRLGDGFVLTTLFLAGCVWVTGIFTSVTIKHNAKENTLSPLAVALVSVWSIQYLQLAHCIAPTNLPCKEQYMRSRVWHAGPFT